MCTCMHASALRQYLGVVGKHGRELVAERDEADELEAALLVQHDDAQLELLGGGGWGDGIGWVFLRGLVHCFKRCHPSSSSSIIVHRPPSIVVVPADLPGCVGRAPRPTAAWIGSRGAPDGWGGVGERGGEWLGVKEERRRAPCVGGGGGGGAWCVCVGGGGLQQSIYIYIYPDVYTQNAARLTHMKCSCV